MARMPLVVHAFESVGRKLSAKVIDSLRKADIPVQEVIDNPHSISDIVVRTKGLVGGVIGLRSYASHMLSRDPETLGEIEEYLSQKGISQMRLLAEGSFALVLDAGEDRVIRIVHQRSEAPRIKSDNILQPIEPMEQIGNYYVEILPKVTTKGVTAEHVSQLRQSLAEEGLILWDTTTLENMGLLPNGKPVLLDSGAVSRSQGVAKKLVQSIASWGKAPDPEPSVSPPKQLARYYDNIPGEAEQWDQVNPEFETPESAVRKWTSGKGLGTEHGQSWVDMVGGQGTPKSRGLTK